MALKGQSPDFLRAACGLLRASLFCGCRSTHGVQESDAKPRIALLSYELGALKYGNALPLASVRFEVGTSLECDFICEALACRVSVKS